jgi:hypothetical protein
VGGVNFRRFTPEVSLSSCPEVRHSARWVCKASKFDLTSYRICGGLCCIGWPFFLPPADRVAKVVFDEVLPDVVLVDDKKRKDNAEKLQRAEDIDTLLEKKENKELKDKLDELLKADGSCDSCLPP